MLEEALRFDWRTAGLWEDRRMAETAATMLLEDAARRSDEHAFHDLWAQTLERMIPPETIAAAVLWVLRQPDAVHVPDVPIYNFRNPFEGRKSPFESQK